VPPTRYSPCDEFTPVATLDASAEAGVPATTTHRTLTLSRYAILVEAARRPELRETPAAGGARVTTWLRLAGSADPGRDLDLVANFHTGLVLHELAVPDPEFDPEPRIAALLTHLIPDGSTDGRRP
jgi:hypothetical protein